MRLNPVKSTLSEGKASIGTWLSLGNSTSARLMARAGFPWLTVDLEHNPIDWSTAATMFAAIADAGCVPLARVPRGDHDLIKRALDGGAMGIVVPMVNTVEEARIAIAAAKYPPEGNRSIGGSLAPINFDTSPAEYFQKANDNILVVLQTESPEGVANADRIYSLPGVDAIFVGPNDLRWQMKTADHPEPTDSEYEAILQEILAAGQRTGTPVGLHVQSTEDALQRAAEGWQFIALQSEMRMMIQQAQTHLKALGSNGTDDVVRY